MTDNFNERDKMQGPTELKFLAVVTLHECDDTTNPKAATFGELMGSLHIIPGILQMPVGTSRPSSGYMKLRPLRHQSHTGRASTSPDKKPCQSPIPKEKPIEPRSLYNWISPRS